MKNTVFLDMMTPCGFCKERPFEETYGGGMFFLNHTESSYHRRQNSSIAPIIKVFIFKYLKQWESLRVLRRIVMFQYYSIGSYTRYVILAVITGILIVQISFPSKHIFHKCVLIPFTLAILISFYDLLICKNFQPNPCPFS
jgi:hypothetical protein